MKRWIEKLEEAKAQYALGASILAVEYILDEAKDLYKEEEEEAKKRQQKEIHAPTYEEDYKKLWEMRDSGCSVEKLRLEFENLRMKQDADRFAASVKKGKEEREKAKKTTFEEIGTETGRLVNAKNKAYGDSFSKSGDVIKILYPKGIAPDQYGDMLAIVRILDKFFRIATDKDAFGESPWQDIAGYALLKVAEIKNGGQKGKNGK